MSLYKQRNSTKWWTKLLINGRVVRVSTKCTNKKDAGKFEKALWTQLNFKRIGLDQEVEKPPQTFRQAVHSFINSLSGTVKDSTIRAYESKSKALIECLGAKYIDKITRDDIENFRSWRQLDKKKAPARLLNKNPKAKSFRLPGSAYSDSSDAL